MLPNYLLLIGILPKFNVNFDCLKLDISNQMTCKKIEI